MPEFELLIPAALASPLIEELSKHFTLHKLWEAPDPDVRLNEVKDRVRGLVSGGTSRFKMTGDFIAQFPRLEIISHMGVGYDQIDAAYAGAHGIVVTNTPDVLTEDVADLALALLLDATRQTPQSDAFVRAGKWLQASYPLTATLRGRTMGILGLGRIGKAIAKRAEAFGIAVAYHGRNQQPGVAYAYYKTPLALAEACDILMIVVPGGAQTRHLVDRKVLEALGPNGILVNVARGSLVDEAALIELLGQGRILAAGLDVFEDEPNVPQPLIDSDRTVLLPHVGSATNYTREAMVQLLVGNLVSWRDGKGPVTPVEETPWRPAK